MHDGYSRWISQYHNLDLFYMSRWIFPFQSITDIEWQNILLNYDDQYSLEHWCFDRIEFANKILNSFELNDIDCTQRNNEIDPDFHYLNDVNISNMLKCNYYVGESFGKLLKARGAMNDFSVMRHNIRSLPANLNEFNIFLEETKHDFSIIGMSETWLKEDNVDHTRK